MQQCCINSDLFRRYTTAVVTDALEVKFNRFDGKAGRDFLWQYRLNIRQAENPAALVALEMRMAMHGFIACQPKSPCAAGSGDLVQQAMFYQPVQHSIDRDPVELAQCLKPIEDFRMRKRGVGFHQDAEHSASDRRCPLPRRLDKLIC
jgi:hypothetical protein